MGIEKSNAPGMEHQILFRMNIQDGPLTMLKMW